MPLTGTVDAANARVDLFVDFTATVGTQVTATLYRRVGDINAENEYVRGLFDGLLLGEQAYVSDHEAPLDKQIWYVAIADDDESTLMFAGPFTIPSSGYVWLKDPGRPWADLRLDLCAAPSRSEAECPAETLVTDTFTRSVTDGWGTADTGQSWTNVGGAAADYSVTAGTGRHTVPANNVFHHNIVPSTTPDVDIRVDWSLPALPLTDSHYVFVMARYTDTTHFYFVRAQVMPAGTMQLSIRKRNGAETLISTSLTLPFTFTPGAFYTLRFQVRGNTMRTRMWPASVAEGDVWQLTASDNDLVVAGSTGVRSLVGTASTSPLPVVFQFDNYQVTTSDPVPVDDLAWVGFTDKKRSVDAGLFPVLNRELPADVYARRKGIETSFSFLSRGADAVTTVYELFTAGGPILIQVPSAYLMDSPYGPVDRCYQPGDLNEAYLSEDQRKVYRLWSAPATQVEVPVGEPQGTDTANWCAVRDSYATFADLTDTGFSWGQVGEGDGLTPPLTGLYGGGLYGDGLYGG